MCSDILNNKYFQFIMLVNRLSSTSALLFQNNFHFGANLKQIKLRMKAVQSIKKITKAMKMVAASKMKADVARLEKARGFGVGSVERIIEEDKYVQKKKTPFTPKKWLLVPITTDKGLCGGVNSNIVREVKAMCKADKNAYKVMCIGDKGSIALSRAVSDIMDTAITNVNLPINFPTASSIAYQVIDQAKDVDKILLLFNEFKNVISQQQRKIEVMNRGEFHNSFRHVTKYDPGELTQHSDLFYDFYLGSVFYNAFLNNIASEQSSRMNAMENASKNAGEILEKITLDYNKARQARITMELCEIISGAAAV